MQLLTFSHKITKTEIIKKLNLFATYKRNYPGGKEFGHLAKILANAAPKPKPPITFYDPSKIQSQLQNNYLLQKTLALYEKNGVEIPFVKEKFPSHSLYEGYCIPGSYTLAPQEKQQIINNDNDIIAQQAYIMSRYAVTIYGGTLVKSSSEVLQRFNQLFTFDSDANNYQKNNELHGIKGLFPKLQHHMALDTYGLLVPTNDVYYGSNINVSTKYISMQTHEELCCLLKTHAFLIKENGDEILVINPENQQHLLLLNKNASFITEIAKQPHPDVLGQRILGLNHKIIYPIDIKRIGEPEIKLNMLSSYSSESPEYHCILAANKMYGQLKTQLGIHKNQFFMEKIDDLNNILLKQKKGKISYMEFEKIFNDFSIQLFQDTINSNQILLEGKSYLPSFIASTTMPQNNPYTHMQKMNPEILSLMRKDAEKHFNFIKVYPTMADFRTFDLYQHNLDLMTYLKKHDMLDNYYAIRKYLCIDELING